MAKIEAKPQTERAKHEEYMVDQWNRHAPLMDHTPRSWIGSNNWDHGFFTFSTGICGLVELIEALPPIEAVAPVDSYGNPFTYTCLAKGHVPSEVRGHPFLADLIPYPMVRIELQRSLPKRETSMRVKWWFLLADEAYEAWVDVAKWENLPQVLADYRTNQQTGEVVHGSVLIRGIQWKGEGVEGLPASKYVYDNCITYTAKGDDDAVALLRRLADLEAARVLAIVEDYHKAKSRLIPWVDDEKELSKEAYVKQRQVTVAGSYRQWRALNTNEAKADLGMFLSHTEAYCLIEGLPYRNDRAIHPYDWEVHWLKKVGLHTDYQKLVDGVPYTYGTAWLKPAEEV